MALTVGTNSYLSVADADSYWSDRNNTTWLNATTADKEKALIEATQFLDGQYTWIGVHPGSNTQLLDWPRNDAVDREGRVLTGIPQKIKDATAELALPALSARLVPHDDRGGAIKRAKVSSIEVEYFDFAPNRKTYEFITMLLRDLIRDHGRMRMVTRV